MQKDPFLSFLSDLSKKITLEKDHKRLMEKINNSEEPSNTEASSLNDFLNSLKDKLVANTIRKPVEEKASESVYDIINRDLEDVEIEVSLEETDNSFTSFVSKLKDIITSDTSVQSNVTATPQLSSKDVVSNDNNILQKDKNENLTSKSYVNELERIKDSIAVEKQDEKVVEIKKLIEEYAEKYIKKAVGIMGESGGGTTAVQFVNGGTMNGDLNVTGNYLSGGVNLLDIFTGGGGGSGDTSVNALVHSNSGLWNTSYTNLATNSAAYLLSGAELGDIPTLSGNWNSTYTTVQTYSADWSSGLQTLSFNENNYDLSISSSNTVNLSVLKDNLSDIVAASASWDSVYTTTKDNSACWNLGCEAYSNLVSNSAAYLSAVDISELIAASGSWNSNYTTVSENSAYWADTRYNVTFGQDVTINGNLTALGTSTFKNTLFTTTTALSVYNTGPGPALYVFQAAGPYDVASFYDGDGVEVLHIGNASGGGNPKGKVGINESFPNVELTVNGQISANNVITALGGNSDQWNSNYTTTSTNSASWTQSFTNLTANSALYILPPLPVPKIWLDNFIPSNVPYLSGSNHNSATPPVNTLGIAGTFTVTTPVCIVNDIAQELLDNFNIFIEMVIFKCKKRSNPIHGMGYSIPIGTASKIWGNFWSRSGSNKNYKTTSVGPHIGPFTPPNPLRYNHLPVFNNGDKIDLSLCLYGRFKEHETFYSLNNDNIYYNSITTIAPFGGKKQAGILGSYTRNYRPMYVAFRYIVWMPNHNYGKGQIISGPLSPTIRISNTYWPFLKDHFASNLYNKPCVTINPAFNKLSFKCKFV